MWRTVAQARAAWRLARSAIVLGITLLGSPASAGTINLELSATPEVRDGSLELALVVRNVGDEAASSVSPVLRFRGETVRGEGAAQLLPQHALETRLGVADAGLTTGRWPYAVAIAYADANQYPLHALHAGTVVAGSPPPLQVAVLGVEPLQLGTSASVRATVKNLSEVARTLAVTVHVPGGIELEESPPAVELEPWGEERISASLRNRTGLPGSRYAAFVSVEYDEGDVHQALVVPVGLEIVVPQSFFERNAGPLFGLALLLVLGWAGLLLWRRAARTR
jgi:hypothetical protein